MSYLKKPLERSSYEKIFVILFIPSILILYTVIKWPHQLVEIGVLDSYQSIYFFGKSPSFWYATAYTLLVCFIALKVLLKQRSPYNPAPNRKLSNYQKWKFRSIFASQLIFFYTAPYIIPALMQDGGFFADPITDPRKMAHVYISPGFVSWFWAFWIFILIPIIVCYFGKRYCSWFCSCGNLAETVGVTKFGINWVRHKTPSGEKAKRFESIQLVTMVLGFFVGIVLLIDTLKLINSADMVAFVISYQDLVIDFIFGSIIGIGLYPFMGTRIWCRYGCPLAKFMELIGRYGQSRFRVQANKNCKGLGLCSSQCPMGIDVASFAHKDKLPIEGSFGLDKTLCIGCGGCIDRCPTKALEFVPLK